MQGKAPPSPADIYRLPQFLFMPVSSEPFLSFMSGYFFSFSFSAARHNALLV